ncbi:hypothetical protein B0H17DRAFT_1142821 [Mycena rosella]|uniref:Uncharacterized protein n=1 Tax=Mycena rosella TaxID=1033263 RepID=A0AAD7G4S1_MYCRO|nr:hypothetical protein B0H17DRAFT_1142821 [Mycena rosella]
MAKGQFTEAQNSHIHSFFTDFVKEMDKGVSGHILTQWKQTKASSILDSLHFAVLDEKLSKQTLFEMIVRKFTNYRNHVYLKSPEAQTSSGSSNIRKTNPLLKFSATTTGRQLFATENHDAITSAAKQRGLDTKNKNAAAYQNILKERWDALSGADQAGWNEQAETIAGDVSKNQAEFVPAIQSALRELCLGTFLGPAEMVLFYAFRETAGGDLIAGTIHGHSEHNRLKFGGSAEELQSGYGKAWSEFTDSVIPRPVILNPSIPRNSSGQPVFPSIDLNNVPIGDLRALLSDYFNHCWEYTAHRGSTVEATTIP